MSIKRKIERAKNAFCGTAYEGIQHYNWVDGMDWFAKFVQARVQDKDLSKLGFYSVFGPHWALRLHKEQKKIFFTGENLNRYSRFKDAGVPFCDLSLGFDEDDKNPRLRFPLWLIYLFSPTDTANDIRQKVKALNTFYPNKTDFASMIAKKDSVNGLRGQIIDALNPIAQVSCGGRFRHNDNRLWQEFKNNKIDYLSHFCFSICPENTDNAGYTTEKLFEAFKAGAVPVYWGSNAKPEADIINLNAVLLWNLSTDNSALIKQIETLYHNPKMYDEFVHQPRLKDNFADYVIDRFDELERRIKALLTD